MTFPQEKGKVHVLLTALDVGLQFVSASDTQMVVHVQPASSASRRHLQAPARPVAAPAAPGCNIVWRNFCGVEENPNEEKHFVGDTGPSRQANTANSVTKHFNLFIDQNVIH